MKPLTKWKWHLSVKVDEQAVTLFLLSYSKGLIGTVMVINLLKACIKELVTVIPAITIEV